MSNLILLFYTENCESGIVRCSEIVSRSLRIMIWVFFQICLPRLCDILYSSYGNTVYVLLYGLFNTFEAGFRNIGFSVVNRRILDPQQIIVRLKKHKAPNNN